MILRPVVRSPVRRPAQPAPRAALVSNSGIAPTTLLDAATSYVHPSLTYTRSGSVYMPQKNGTLSSFGANVPPRGWDSILGWHYRVDPGWSQVLLQTHDPSNAAWTKAQVNTVTQAAAGPNGSTDAWVVTEDTTASAAHNVKQSLSFTSGTPYTFVAVASARSGDRYLQLFAGSAAFGANAIVCFDLISGASVKNASFTSCGSVKLANGYWLLWASAVATASAAAEYQIRLSPTFSAAGASYTGNGTSGVNLWAANVTTTAYQVPVSLATAAGVVIGSPTWSGTLAGLGLSGAGAYSVGADFEASLMIGTPPARTVVRVDDGGANDHATISYTTTANQLSVAVNSTAGGALYGQTAARNEGTRVNAGVRVAAAGPRGMSNWSLMTAGGAITLPVAPTTLRIGVGQSGNHFAGGIGKVWAASASLNDAQIVAAAGIQAPVASEIASYKTSATQYRNVVWSPVTWPEPTLGGITLRHLLDIDLPAGSPPANGWPVVLYFHANASTHTIGSGSLSTHRAECLAAGLAFISVEFRHPTVNVDQGAPHTDVGLAAQWVRSFATTLQLDANNVLCSAKSRGSLCVWQALQADMVDPNASGWAGRMSSSIRAVWAHNAQTTYNTVEYANTFITAGAERTLFLGWYPNDARWGTAFGSVPSAVSLPPMTILHEGTYPVGLVTAAQADNVHYPGFGSALRDAYTARGASASMTASDGVPDGSAFTGAAAWLASKVV